MSTKIFPMRRYNPDKGRANVPELPPLHITPKEDLVIMRELMKEVAQLELEKRSKVLSSKPIHDKPLSMLAMCFYKPEFVIAFMSLGRTARKALARKRKYKYMEDVNKWLDTFQMGAESFCAACGFEITAHEKDLVPYELIVIETHPLIIEGLCAHCKELSYEIKVGKIISTNNLNVLSLTIVRSEYGKEDGIR